MEGHAKPQGRKEDGGDVDARLTESSTNYGPDYGWKVTRLLQSCLFLSQTTIPQVPWRACRTRTDADVFLSREEGKGNVEGR
jgi:hypothetical protein